MLLGRIWNSIKAEVCFKIRIKQTQLSGIKVIGLPSEHCEILMGQPDHLDTGAAAEGTGH